MVAVVDQYQLAEAVDIGEAVKVNKHPVLVGRYIVAIGVHEVQNHHPVFIYGVVVVPVAYHYLQPLPLMGYKAFQPFPFEKACRMEIHEEIYYGRKEVLRRVGEERLRAALLLASSLVERCEQRRRRFRSRREVGYILALDRIDAVGILHISEVYLSESTVVREFAALAVLAILVK